MKVIALAAALFASTVPAQAVETDEPAAMATALTAMGYKPGAIEAGDGTPMFHVMINDFDTVMVFGGCTEGKTCKYILLVSRFTDIKSPPSDWLNARNAELDLGKAWIGDDGTLSFSLPVPAGGEPMTAPMLRFVLDQWRGIVGNLSRSAIDAKLDK